jgi:DNA mismatch endonuclease (patch repair protein)
MSAVRRTGTSPELKLRKALWAAGVRGWRCDFAKAPGRPDLAWPKRRVAVFVDGAFWHGHPSRHKPGRSGSYWDEKIARNVERDCRVDRELRDQGWVVERFWDFEVEKDLDRTVVRVTKLLNEP